MIGQIGDCQIHLVLEVATGASERLHAALNASPIASVQFQSQSGSALTPASLKGLVETAQKRGVAALIADNPALAASIQADGAHLHAGADLATRYTAARQILGTRAIVGIDCGGSRHLAMELGEAGADYIGIGEARIVLDTDDDAGALDGSELKSTPELVSWWSDIFEVPCVAFDARSIGEMEQLVAAGADFLAVTIPATMAVCDVADLVRAASEIARNGGAAQ